MTRTTVYIALITLTACFGNNNYAPLIERRGQVSEIPDLHRVRAGETLYAIAWRYGMDYRELASANNIVSPFTIYPGQAINLETPAVAPVKPPLKPPAGPKKTPPASSARPVSKPTVTAAKKSPPRNKTISSGEHPWRWQWPASGRIMRAWSASNDLHKGIDIQGKLGEPVLAANSGKVVYAGSGLVGYGNLLIIKHPREYLSAYGHNRKILVNEGDLVTVGQHVAEFGDSGTDRVKLHFEIRRNNQSLNPLKLLPKR